VGIYTYIKRFFGIGGYQSSCNTIMKSRNIL
jgi:hypothetical protein